MKHWFVWVFFLLSVFFAWWSYTSIEYETKDQNLTLALQEKVTVGYLDTQILDSIKKENFDDVEMYQKLAKLLDYRLLPTTLEKIEKHNEFLEKSWRNTKEFVSGFLKGKSESVLGMSGSIASDLTLYGDIRDLKEEGTKYLDGESYDDFILSISMVGIGLSATQLLSAGAATPLKVGASVVKVSEKSGKLTKPFKKILSKRLSKTVDTKMLKTLKFNSMSKLDNNLKAIGKSVDIKPVKSLFKDVNVIKANTSMTDTISLMKYVDTPKELKAIGKISKTYKGNTKAVMTVLGKGALRAGKTVVKFTTKFMMKLVGLVLSVFGFLITFVFKIRSLGKVRNIAF